MSGLRVSVGSRIRYEGNAYEIVDQTTRAWTLRALSDSALSHVSITHALGSDGFALLDRSDVPPAVPSNALLDRVPKAELERAQWRYGHVLEAVTGYRSGDPAGSLANEPRAEYDPSLVRSLRQRFMSKVGEMKSERPQERVSATTLFRWKTLAVDQRLGILGLCDARYHGIRDPFRGIAREVIEALDAVLDEHVDLSTVPIVKIRHDVRDLVRQRHCDEVRMPGRTRFYEIYRVRTRQTGANKEATYRRGAARRRSPTPSPMRARRSGELLVVDSTVVDLQCIDRRTGRLVRPEFSIGVDAYDHSLRCVRVIPAGTRGVDAALLLYDALRPEPWLPHWPIEAQWNYSGVPRRIAVIAGGQNLPAGIPAQLPFGRPTMVVVDHGKIFLSASFFAGCAEFGISVLPAPPGRPSYKGIVEQFFDTANTWLWSRLRGHTGRNAAHRGRSSDARAAVFLDELRDLFVEWAITVYHDREHDGCRLPDAPQLAVTPNIMFENSVAQNGFINAVPHPERLVRLLPVEWRRINADGIKIGNLKYWHDILQKWMREKSRYGKGNRWPFHVDPRELSRIWFFDPDDRAWFTLRRLNSRHPDSPFSDAGLAWVKRMMIEEGLDIRDEDATNDALDAFLERNQLRLPRSEREQRVIERMAHVTGRARDDFLPLDDIPVESQGKTESVDAVVFGAPVQPSPSPLRTDLERLQVVPPSHDGEPLVDHTQDGAFDDVYDEVEPLGTLD